MSATSWPAFADSLPMFFGTEHRAVAEANRVAMSEISPQEHDLDRVLRWMKKSELFRFVIPNAFGGREVNPARRGSIDLRALCLTREALGYVSPMADSILAVQGLGTYPVVLTDTLAGKADFLNEAARGDRIGAFALTEPEAGSDVASLQSTARREGEHWFLEGEKVFISNVGIATHYVVFANANPKAGKKGISAFLVDADAQGLELESVPLSVDHPLGRLRMNRCKARALLGNVGQGMRLALGTLDMFRTSVGAAASGMAKRAIDESVRRVTSRIQFGQPLAAQQLTQAKLAEMATDLEASRLLVYRAACLKDSEKPASTEVAMAKMFATEAAQRIIDAAVQLHGGLGVTKGTLVESLYREIRPLRIYEGTTEIQKLIIGSALVKETQQG